VRPFGAIVFGRIGDLVGRKYTFLVTILFMGGATFLVGLLPTFESIGWAAPFLLVTLRLVQGLALGGEYGGAATYVAEHAPHGKRGYDTAWIQTTATWGSSWRWRSSADAGCGWTPRCSPTGAGACRSGSRSSC
jgi:MFS family permease